MTRKGLLIKDRSRSEKPVDIGRRDWILATYYTKDYEVKAAHLRETSEANGVALHGHVMSFAGYRDVLAYKPEFILKTLRRFKRPVVYIDVDFEMMAYPELFDNPAGVDFMIYNWFADHDNFIPGYNPNQLLSSSGVVYFNYSKPAMELLYNWSKLAAKYRHCADDQLLDKVFNEGRFFKRMKCRWLPSSYLRIAPYFPGITPVLNHPDEPGKAGPAPAPVDEFVHYKPWGRRFRKALRRIKGKVKSLANFRNGFNR